MTAQEIDQLYPRRVFWTERNLTLRVLGEKTTDTGSKRLVVQKITGDNLTTVFSLSPKDVVVLA